MGDFLDIISDDLLSLHEMGVDDLIESDVGETCVIKYAPVWIDCPSCEVDAIGNKPSSINIYGRRIPLSPGNKCVHCGDTGKIQQEVTENIRALVYWSINKSSRSSSWLKVNSTQIQVPNNYIEILTYRTNLHKILKSNFIEVSTREQPGKIYRYKLDGEPEPAGFRGKYIACLLSKAN